MRGGRIEGEKTKNLYHRVEWYMASVESSGTEDGKSCFPPRPGWCLAADG